MEGGYNPYSGHYQDQEDGELPAPPGRYSGHADADNRDRQYDQRGGGRYADHYEMPRNGRNEHDRDYERDYDRDYSYAMMGRDRDRERSRDRDRDRSWDRDRERDRRRNRSRSRERGGRDRSRSRERRRRSRSRSRERERWRNDRYSDEDDYGRDERGNERERRGVGRDMKPSSTLFVKGIPLTKGEGDVMAFFSSQFPGVRGARLIMDRSTGVSRGFAFLDLESTDAARAVMEASGPYGQVMDGQSLWLEYSDNSIAGGGGGGAGVKEDWLCTRCSAVNFARRVECFQCCTPRSKDAQRVPLDPEGPSPILKISGLEPQTTEDDIRHFVVPHVPVKDIRLVREKYTAAPRGFGYVHFHSVADAGRAMAILQGSCIPGQETAVRFAYARDRQAPPGAAGGGGSSIAADALGAANFSAQYSNWEPKEYGKDSSAEGSEQQQGADTSGYQYDASTGYYYDSASGYYYDPNTGLFCNPTDQQWYMYNNVTGGYLPVGAGGQQAPETPAEKAAAAAAAVTAAVTAPAASAVPAAEKKKKKPAATIGAAPQISAEALKAKAREAKLELLRKQKALEKEAERKKKEEQAAAAAAAAAAQAMPPPAIRPAGIVHTGKQGKPSGVIYQGKWRGPKPQAPQE